MKGCALPTGRLTSMQPTVAQTRETEMVNILHRLGMQTPNPKTVYDALTTVDGLAAW